MIAKQPFYLLGLDDYDQCKDNAFGAMWLFIVIFGASLFFLVYESHLQSNHDRASQGLDCQYRPILPSGMSDYEVSSSLGSELEMSDIGMGMGVMVDYLDGNDHHHHHHHDDDDDDDDDFNGLREIS